MLCFLKICKQCLDTHKNIPINGTFMPIPRDKIQHYASLNPYSGISALHSLMQEIRNDFSFSWSQVPVPIRLFFVTSERKKNIYNNTIYFYLLPTLVTFLDRIQFCLLPYTWVFRCCSFLHLPLNTRQDPGPTSCVPHLRP